MKLRTDSLRTYLAEPRRVQEWQDLAVEIDGTLFQTPAWSSAWIESFDPEDCVVVSAYDHDALIGILPLAKQTRRLHRSVSFALPFWGIVGSGLGAADHCSPLASNRDVMVSLVEEAIKFTYPDSLLLEHCSGEFATTCRQMKMRELGSTRVPRIDLTEVDSTEQVWSAKLRKNLRRRRRKMTEAGVTARWITESPAVATSLYALQEVHRLRWEDVGQEGLLADERLEFLERLIAGVSAPFTVESLVLEKGEQTVGSLLIFVTPTTIASYKTGWHPDFSHLGIGIELHVTAIERAVATDKTLYDFLRGTGSHKYTLGASDMIDYSFGLFRGPRGVALGAREFGSYRIQERTLRKVQ